MVLCIGVHTQDGRYSFHGQASFPLCHTLQCFIQMVVLLAESEDSLL